MNSHDSPFHGLSHTHFPVTRIPFREHVGVGVVVGGGGGGALWSNARTKCKDTRVSAADGLREAMVLCVMSLCLQSNTQNSFSTQHD